MERVMRKVLASAVAVLALGLTRPAPAAAAAFVQKPPPNLSWSFDGPFGTYNRAALQRGYQVYKEVCSACHSMKYLHYRDLSALGYSKAEIKAIASGYMVTAGPNKEGSMYKRPGRPSDAFVSPFPNKEAAAAAFGGVAPPDLSLMAEARKGGPNYIYCILTSFGKTPPKGMFIPTGRFYNPCFPGGRIAMPPPLTANRVHYTDGTKATLDQEARDVATFLMWASHPHLEQRHRIGVKVMLFLIVLAVVFFFAKRRLWKDVEH